MKKNHVKTKPESHAAKKADKELNSNSQAGFLSLSPKEFMNNSNTLVVAISLGIVVLLGFSLYLIFNKSTEKELALNVTPTPVKAIITPYPTIPKEIKDTTVLVNSRSLNPISETIKVGGAVGFFNEDNVSVEIRGYDNASSNLNLGFVQPADVKFVTFEKVGVYKFINPQNPEEVGEITVTD